MFRRFKEKHPYFFDQFRRIAGKVALGALLLYGCGLLIVLGLWMGPLSPVMFLYVLWLLIEFIPDLLLPGRSLKRRQSLFEFENNETGHLTLRQLIWKIAFAAVTIYTCVVILIAGYISKTLQVLLLSHIIAVPILIICLFRLIKTIRRCLANRNKKVTLDENTQNELARAEELYRAGIYSRKEFTEKKARILEKAADKPVQNTQRK